MPEMFGKLEQHVMPNGTAVYYRDSDHSYWRDIKHVKGRYSGTGRLTGVSTVVKPLDYRPDGLMRWAAKFNNVGIASVVAEALEAGTVDELRSRLRWLTNSDAIWRELEMRGLLYDQARDRKATVGTNVHETALHALAQGRPVPDLASLTAEERGYAQGVIKFWLDHEPRALHSEKVVCDLDLEVAGRFDMMAALHGSYLGEPLNGAICMVDAKTGTFRSAKEQAQVAGYEMLADQCGYGACDRMFILQVLPDGEYKLIECCSTRDAFRNAVAVYRDAAEIGKQSRRERERVEGYEAVAA